MVRQLMAAVAACAFAGAAHAATSIADQTTNALQSICAPWLAGGQSDAFIAWSKANGWESLADKLFSIEAEGGRIEAIPQGLKNAERRGCNLSISFTAQTRPTEQVAAAFRDWRARQYPSAHQGPENDAIVIDGVPAHISAWTDKGLTIMFAVLDAKGADGTDAFISVSAAQKPAQQSR